MALHISIRKIGWLFIDDGNSERVVFEFGVIGGDDIHWSVGGSDSVIVDVRDVRNRLGSIGISPVGLRCRGSRPISFRHLLWRLCGRVCSHLGSLRHRNPDGKPDIGRRCDHGLDGRRKRARIDDQRTGKREFTEHGSME